MFRLPKQKQLVQSFGFKVVQKTIGDLTWWVGHTCDIPMWVFRFQDSMGQCGRLTLGPNECSGDFAPRNLDELGTYIIIYELLQRWPWLIPQMEVTLTSAPEKVNFEKGPFARSLSLKNLGGFFSCLFQNYPHLRFLKSHSCLGFHASEKRFRQQDACEAGAEPFNPDGNRRRGYSFFAVELWNFCEFGFNRFPPFFGEGC